VNSSSPQPLTRRTNTVYIPGQPLLGPAGRWEPGERDGGSSAQLTAGRGSGGGEVRNEDHTAALTRRAGWWLIVPVDSRGQQMPATRRERAPEVVTLG
jgi:hypothetical protein